MPWTAAHQAFLPITNSQNLLAYVYRVGDAIQPSHPLSSPSPPTFNIIQKKAQRKVCVPLKRRVQFSSVAHLCPTFATPWTTAHQASLSITNSQSLLKLMSIELVMPSNHCILCHKLLLLPSSFLAPRSSPMTQFFVSGDQIIGASASASVLPMNIQD